MTTPSQDKLINIFDDHFDSVDEMDLIGQFTCILCYTVAIEPIKCERCSQIYCSSCLPKDAFDKSLKIKYPNKSYSCYKMCGEQKLAPMTRLERNALNSIIFNCQHAESHGCKAKLKYDNIRVHLEKECVYKLNFAADKVYVITDPKSVGTLDPYFRNLFLEEGEQAEPLIPPAP